MFDPSSRVTRYSHFIIEVFACLLLYFECNANCCNGIIVTGVIVMTVYIHDIARALDI